MLSRNSWTTGCKTDTCYPCVSSRIASSFTCEPPAPVLAGDSSKSHVQNCPWKVPLLVVQPVCWIVRYTRGASRFNQGIRRTKIGDRLPRVHHTIHRCVLHGAFSMSLEGSSICLIWQTGLSITRTEPYYAYMPQQAGFQTTCPYQALANQFCRSTEYTQIVVREIIP